MADRLKALSAEPMAFADTAPGEQDRQPVRSDGSLLHTAMGIRFFAA